MKTTLLTLALSAAGVAAVAVAHAQPAPAPTAPPAAPAPTATTDPNAPPPPGPDAPPPAPTTTSTAAPTAPPPAAPPAPVDPNAPPAQGDPNAPPPPPPVAPPPPVTAPPVAPPPPPVFVPPPVITQPTTPPPAQPAPAPAAKPKPSFLSNFAGSSISWNNSVGATLMGLCPVGNTVEGLACQGGESDTYTQTFTIQPAFFLYRGDKHLVRAVSSFSILTEMTNSDSTTKVRQPDLFDVPIRIIDTIPVASWGAGEGGAAAGALARDPTLAGAAEYRTWLSFNGGVNFPTSRSSQGSGIYLTSVLGASVRQQVKLMGSSADFLNNITFTLGETWWHQFSRATTRTNLELDRERQTAGGGPILSDQLGGGALSENRLIHSLSFFMPIVGDLQLNGLFQIWNDFPYQFEGSTCEVEIDTGCVDLDKSQTKMRALTQFDVSLYYQISPEIGADVGYNNFSGQLGEDGKWRNPFFSPSSLFYADIILFPDQLIKRIITPSKPKTQVGKR